MGSDECCEDLGECEGISQCLESAHPICNLLRLYVYYVLCYYCYMFITSICLLHLYVIYYLCHRFANGEGIVTLSICVSVCVSAKPRLHAAVVSVAKVMHCIQCCLVNSFNPSQKLPKGERLAWRKCAEMGR